MLFTETQSLAEMTLTLAMAGGLEVAARALRNTSLDDYEFYCDEETRKTDPVLAEAYLRHNVTLRLISNWARVGAVILSAVAVVVLLQVPLGLRLGWSQYTAWLSELLVLATFFMLCKEMLSIFFPGGRRGGGNKTPSKSGGGFKYESLSSGKRKR